MNTYYTDITTQRIQIEGIFYTHWEIAMIRMNIPTDKQSFRQELFTFLSEWFNHQPTVLVHTSGSTGKPKPMRVEKESMMESACLTCSFLGLKENDTALLCMPLQYIAGKMVVIRSLVAGLNLLPVTPSGHPLKNLKKAPVFAAMIPMQVYNSLQVPEEKELLKQIKHLIIGGGAIDSALAQALKDFPNQVWSTYGMTETLSHIALRRVNGTEASEWYTPFESVSIAELNDQGQFRILGRKDNIINSGGVKIQIEQVEATLKKHFHTPFMITSAPDAKFGEIVVLLIENNPGSRDTYERIQKICEDVLPAYWCPKRVIPVENLPLTETGKPDRATAKLLAQT